MRCECKNGYIQQRILRGKQALHLQAMNNRADCYHNLELMMKIVSTIGGGGKGVRIHWGEFVGHGKGVGKYNK